MVRPAIRHPPIRLRTLVVRMRLAPTPLAPIPLALVRAALAAVRCPSVHRTSPAANNKCRGPASKARSFRGPSARRPQVSAHRRPPSIKTEIAFPLEKPISMNNVFDRVISPAGTECGRCHVGEQQMTYDGFPDGAWISQVNEPQTTFDVPVDALRDDAESCDPSDKPD